MSTFPTAPGIPALPPGNVAPPAQTSVMTEDAPSVSGQAAAAVWGIFNASNELVIEADSVVSLDYRQDWRVADFPIEDGGFASYDKVQLPYDVRVGLTKGGSVTDRAAFLAAIDAIDGDTNLYSVVTPEKTYTNVNVVHVNYRRTGQSGLGLLTVEIWLQEIRPAGSAALSTNGLTSGVGQNTQSISGADRISDGTVQAAQATTQQQAAVSQVT